MKKNMVALDCGNSSFRTVLGQYDGETIRTEVLTQEEHDMVRVREYDYWDILQIYSGLLSGLAKGVQAVPRLDSIGVCTWGVDFGLFDGNGFLLGNPLSYRNTLGETYLNRLSEAQKRELFFATGILCDKINSVYLLQGIRDRMPKRWQAAEKLLMMPDILNYMLTGKMEHEPSELSTTQLMDVRTGQISPSVCGKMGIAPELFCSVGVHGRKIGDLLPAVREAIGAGEAIPVLCVPSHDTAAAVLAIPAEEEDFIFISSGTWSLIGTELDAPRINEAVLKNGFTNEAGAFGTVTLLKNSAGMFLIQRIRRELQAERGCTMSWDAIVDMGKAYTGTPLLFDVNNARFFNPKSMSREIYAYLTDSGQWNGGFDWSVIIRSVYESMACSYAVAAEQLEEATGKRYNEIYIVGGGSQNGFLNELTARRTGKTVVACGKESTSIGSIAAQLRYFMPDKTMQDLRAILRRSVPTKRFGPFPAEPQTVEQYKTLEKGRQ